MYNKLIIFFINQYLYIYNRQLKCEIEENANIQLPTNLKKMYVKHNIYKFNNIMKYNICIYVNKKLIIFFNIII